MKDHVSAYLSKYIFCVVSTVTPESTPESAFVGYRHSSNLEFLIGTSKLSRKYQNLQNNAHVAIVVADTSGEVQYEGNAEVMSHKAYDKLVADGTFQALPGIEKYRGDPNQVFLKVTPIWLRFIQHGETDQITEMTEF